MTAAVARKPKPGPLPPRVIGHRGAAALAPENTLAGFRKALQPSRDIDAVAVYIPITDDHITGIYADAKLYPTIGIDPGVVLGQSSLYVEPATDGVNGALELGEKPIACAPDEPAAILGNFGLD